MSAGKPSRSEADAIRSIGSSKTLAEDLGCLKLDVERFLEDLRQHGLARVGDQLQRRGRSVQDGVAEPFGDDQESRGLALLHSPAALFRLDVLDHDEVGERTLLEPAGQEPAGQRAVVVGDQELRLQGSVAAEHEHDEPADHERDADPEEQRGPVVLDPQEILARGGQEVPHYSRSSLPVRRMKRLSRLARVTVVSRTVAPVPATVLRISGSRREASGTASAT